MSRGIKSIYFWRAVLAEYIATTLFLYITCSVTLAGPSTYLERSSLLFVSLAIGLTYASISYIFLHFNAGHMNPAITFGLFVGRSVGFFKALFFLIVQFGGAITGAAICYAITPDNQRQNLGNLVLSSNYNKWRGFAMEGVLTVAFVLTAFAATDRNRHEKGFGPSLALGFVLAAAHFVALPVTGCGLNPVRAIAPAIILDRWPTYHWIYHAGPVAGALIAGMVYGLVFKVPEENAGSVDLNHDFIMERPAGIDGKRNKGDHIIYSNTNI